MNSELRTKLRGAAGLGSRKKRALEGYGVDVAVIFTRRGAPNTADYPPQYAIAAERTPLHLVEAGPRAEERRNGSVRRRKVQIAFGRMIVTRMRCGLLELEPDEDTPIIWRTTLFPAPPEEI